MMETLTHPMALTTAHLTTVQAVLVVALVAVGSFFLLVGTIGLLRLPTVYNRMHATSKATTLGAASMFLAGAVYFSPVTVALPVVGSVPVLPQGIGLTSLVGIVFLFATAPTGAHVISRSAQKMGIEFVEDVRWPDQVDAGETGDADNSVDEDSSGDDGSSTDADSSDDEGSSADADSSDDDGSSTNEGSSADEDRDPNRR